MRTCQRCRRCPRAGRARRLRPPPQRFQVRSNVCLQAQYLLSIKGAGMNIMCLALSSCTRGGFETECHTLGEALLHFPLVHHSWNMLKVC